MASHRAFLKSIQWSLSGREDNKLSPFLFTYLINDFYSSH